MKLLSKLSNKLPYLLQDSPIDPVVVAFATACCLPIVAAGGLAALLG
jgi:hypothetical protein